MKKRIQYTIYKFLWSDLLRNKNLLKLHKVKIVSISKFVIDYSLYQCFSVLLDKYFYTLKSRFFETCSALECNRKSCESQ